jgi:diguanylate cyclase (GGDEF)-like protein
MFKSNPIHEQNIDKSHRLELMLQAMADRILLINEEMVIVEQYGSTAKTLTDFDMLYPKHVSQELKTALANVLSSQQAITFRYSVLLCEQLDLSIAEIEAWNGIDERWFEVIIKPIDSCEKTGYVLLHEREITQTYMDEKELRRLADTDELTQVLNRRAFTQHLEQTFNDSANTAVSCLMIDIDHFKEINDRVGHLSGDEVITRVARICQDNIRSNDYIGRLGGEEFGIMLNKTNAIQAYDVAERIREAVASSSCHIDGHIIIPTVSIGIAELTTQISSVRELMVNADKAMYYSKQTGRNQVTVHHDNLPYLSTTPSNGANIRRAG